MRNGYAYCQMLFEGDRPVDFVYLAVNPAFGTLTGLRNVAGRRVTEVIPGIRETGPELFEIYGRVAQGASQRGSSIGSSHWMCGSTSPRTALKKDVCCRLRQYYRAQEGGGERCGRARIVPQKALRSIPDPLVISRLADGSDRRSQRRMAQGIWLQPRGGRREKSSFVLNLFADSADLLANMPWLCCASRDRCGTASSRFDRSQVQLTDGHHHVSGASGDSGRAAPADRHSRHHRAQAGGGVAASPKRRAARRR